MKLMIFYDGFDKSNFLFIDSTSQCAVSVNQRPLESVDFSLVRSVDLLYSLRRIGFVK